MLYQLSYSRERKISIVLLNFTASGALLALPHRLPDASRTLIAHLREDAKG